LVSDDDPDDRMRLEQGAAWSRRSVLQRAGWMMAAAAWPSVSRGGSRTAPTEQAQPSARTATTSRHPVSDVTARLSTYMSDAGDRPLPDTVLEQAKWHILDTIAAMISGSELPPGRAAIAFARAHAGNTLSTIVGDTALCGPIEAALANGVLAHADETDDSWPSGWHPGCNTVPAALAVGEQFMISGARFVRAVALGYDVGARVLIATRAGLTDTHKATHAVAGVWGATAAASCAAGLTAQQMRWALDYTAQQSSGIGYWYRDSSHIEKGFVFGGMPARNGVTSALLVQLGWNGVDDVMSGRDNYLLATSPQARADLLIDALGERYEIARTNIKRWTVGSPIQAPLDAMEALLTRQPVDPDRVREILVRSPPESVVDNSDPPDINIQHAMAVMMIDKTVTFRSIHDLSRMQDPRVLRLRAMVRLEAPAGGGGAVRLPLLEIALNDGTRLTQDTGPVLGTVDHPMTREQFVGKCRDLMAPVLGEQQCTRLIDRVLDLERIKDVRELRPLLQRTYRAGAPRLSEYPSRR
jgi:2-methylcitrate dehydratase PrpD